MAMRASAGRASGTAALRSAGANPSSEIVRYPMLAIRVPLFVRSAKGDIGRLVDRYELLLSRVDSGLGVKAVDHFITNVAILHGRGKAQLFFSELGRRKGVELEHLYTGAMLAFSRLSRADEVSSLYLRAKKANVDLPAAELSLIRNNLVGRGQDGFQTLLEAHNVENCPLSIDAMYRVTKQHLREKSPEEAMKAALEAEEKGLIPSGSSAPYGAIIRAFVESDHFGFVGKILTALESRGFEWNFKILLTLTKCKDVKVLDKVAQAIQARFSESSQLWRSLSSGYERIGEDGKANEIRKSHVGVPQGLLNIAKQKVQAEMEAAESRKRSGLEIMIEERSSTRPVHVLEEALEEACKKRAYSEASDLLSQASRLKIFPSRAVYTYAAEVLIAHGKSGAVPRLVRSANRVLKSDDAKANVVSHVLTKLRYHGDYEAMRKLVKDNTARILLASPALQHKALLSLACAGYVDECYELFGSMKAEHQLGRNLDSKELVSAYSSLVVAHGVKRDLQGLETAVKGLEKSGAELDQGICVILIKAYASFSRKDQLEHYYHKAKSFPVVSAKIFEEVVDYYSRTEDFNGILEVYADMMERRVHPTARFFNNAFSIFRVKDADESTMRNLLRWARREMYHKGVEGNALTFELLMTYFTNRKMHRQVIETYMLLRQDKERRITGRSYRLALSSCLQLKQLPTAKYVIGDMRERGFKPGMSHLDRLVALYALYNDVEQAVKYLEKLLKVPHMRLSRKTHTRLKRMIETAFDPRFSKYEGDPFKDFEAWRSWRLFEAYRICRAGRAGNIQDAHDIFGSVPPPDLNANVVGAMFYALATADDLRGLRKMVCRFEDSANLLNQNAVCGAIDALWLSAGKLSAEQFWSFLDERQVARGALTVVSYIRGYVKFCDIRETIAAVESTCNPEHGWTDPTDLCSGILELFIDNDSTKKRIAEAFVAWYPKLVSRPHIRDVSYLERAGINVVEESRKVRERRAIEAEKRRKEKEELKIERAKEWEGQTALLSGRNKNRKKLKRVDEQAVPGVHQAKARTKLRRK
ncbi:hypothetical protein NDN08_006534 [Rhodosorus marinus]|uniref:Pentacotripeptide-repeat region of PRORP domain-containing protein n=1 Tax=Rhodosorus marinus TaxID=101924 RepID=A0AAV8UN89_9RHOD|nr:hypothetical protein NDN08_006534 [Rhodosorus marinus]